MAEFLPRWNTRVTVAARSLTQGHWHVLINYEGGEAILKRSTQELSQLVHELQAVRLDALEADFSRRLRLAICEMYAHIQSSSPLATLLRFAFLPSACGIVEPLHSLAERLSLRCAWLLRAPGTLFFWLLPEQKDEQALAVLTQAAREMQQVAMQKQSHFSVLRCPRTLKTDINIWGQPGPDARLMRQLKAAFDPHNIFAPGRFLGGM